MYRSVNAQHPRIFALVLKGSSAANNDFWLGPSQFGATVSWTKLAGTWKIDRLNDFYNSKNVGYVKVTEVCGGVAFGPANTVFLRRTA